MTVPGLYLSAQTSITGKVTDIKTHGPIAKASVYINGTRQGVYTDANGEFTLTNVAPPCELVVSHLGYLLKVIHLKEADEHPLSISLIEKSRQLDSVRVSGNSRREQNLKEFKKWFLDQDKWGKSAVILNEDVLYFSRHTDTVIRRPDKRDSLRIAYKQPFRPNEQWSADSSTISTYVEVFSVSTNAPLHLQLPFQGYEVMVDIEEFILRTDHMHTVRTYSFFSRFMPVEAETERELKRIEKNRELVYYNSSRHFCRSLFSGALFENGYLAYLRSVRGNGLYQISWQQVDLSPYISVLDRNRIQITGLKGKQLAIYYFCKSSGKPLKLTGKTKPDATLDIPWDYYDIKDISNVTFMSDTCIIHRDGTIPDNNLMFSGRIGSKCGGALLPIDYFPVEIPEKPGTMGIQPKRK